MAEVSGSLTQQHQQHHDQTVLVRGIGKGQMGWLLAPSCMLCKRHHVFKTALILNSTIMLCLACQLWLGILVG